VTGGPESAGIAALPMYDWPELRPATDRLWAAIRDRLRGAGIGAPEALTRDIGLVEGWTHPRLVLGQTCGLPYVRGLAALVALVGTPDYGVPGCAPGWYRSAVVVRTDDPRGTLADFREGRLAVNGADSQSGWGAILHHAAPLAVEGRFFGAVAVSGAHAASVTMVAGGAADLAAIDFVSWRHCLRLLPEAARLRVLMLTEPTPGLPMIAAAGSDVEPRARAVEGAIEAVGGDTRAEFGLVGFARLEAGAYDVIAQRLAAAEARLPEDVLLT
jgi:ABC-type phosphate/phosphonate transport system substrate-binding protein